MGLMKSGLTSLLVVLSLGGGLITASTTAQAKSLEVTITDDSGKQTVTYNGKKYTAEQAVKLGLIVDKTVNAKENRWAYQVTNVKAKRTKSGKSVKVSGKLKVTNIRTSVFTPAKNVQISVGNTTKLAKLSKKLTFSQVVKTKAKKLKLRAGYTEKIKGHKSFTVLSANKQFKVKAYK
ncbi:hypothetical protein [Levilactobacillus yonginensis]|uniref:hypothetical protein n=1 Tax=Levilactobacillus yonginensis TaxID=1054041 RepID=UPI000F76DFDD|nr:hypothetical protein [Levilactobacillus yonginensis]